MPNYPGPAQFIQFFKGWRASLQAIIPNWQTQRPPTFTNGFRWLFSMVTPVDIMTDNLLQGINDWGPGSPNASPTTLALIGQSRGLIQGEAETNDHFAQRLRNWRTNGLFTAPPLVPQVWSQRGNARVLVQQVQQYLGNTPMVRKIERIFSTSGAPQGRYITVASNGTITDQLANWDWDSQLGWTDPTLTYAGGQTRQFWSDFWLVIYPSEYSIAGSITPLTGQRVPKVSHDAILSILNDWKGAHEFCRAIIWSYSATLFDPANPGAAGNPDGTWGNWAKVDGSGNSIPARNVTNARYWIPPQG
jgi:hypothetical protein